MTAAASTAWVMSLMSVAMPSTVSLNLDGNFPAISSVSRGETFKTVSGSAD